MPQKRREPHLILRRARYKAGKLTHRPAWVIKDGDKSPVSTGCGESEHEEAKLKLHEYNVREYQKKALNLNASDDSPATPAREYPIATALMLYQHHRVAELAARLSTKGKQPKAGVDHKQVGELKRRLEHLLDWWGDKYVSQINTDRCRAFGKEAKNKKGETIALTPSYKGRCLDDLKAAVRFAMSENKCESVALYWDIPKHPRRKRTTFYTRGHVAKMVLYAWRKKGRYVYSAKKSGAEKAGVVKETSLRPMRHIARLILVAAGTGTRSERCEMASFYDIPGHPWIDVDKGVFWRSWDGENVAGNKRADPCVLHPTLLLWCRKWKDQGLRFLTEYRGRPVKVSSAFYRLVREVLGDEAPGRSIHTFRHSAATWLLSSSKKLNPYDIAGFLGMDVQVLLKVYGKYSVDFQASIRDAFADRAVGRSSVAPRQAADPLEALLLEERRRSLYDLAEAFDAPASVTALIDATPASGIDSLRSRIRQAGRSGNWKGFGDKRSEPATDNLGHAKLASLR
ncbi:hypothetical protein [Tianweitania sediminis]|uniref:Phage integrase family protein n=1 Tax=Tianweitania sediminis TaxID=1502156 RepID=A0A8J7UJC9_9HYPH|nr:hypothetical protein [Tianweitania sediminis]MBP0439893.1 hypothetical protein [Tianweitania sediminis]